LKNNRQWPKEKVQMETEKKVKIHSTRIEVFAFNSFAGYVTRLTQLVPLVEQELLIPAEHLSSPRV
jgi:hypothetical protein